MNSFVQGSLYFLRTVNQFCSATTPRAIVLNFSSIVTPPSSCTPISDRDDTGTLNPCGTNSIPDVRFSATTLFRKSVSTTPLTLFLNLNANFRETDFELDFLNPVPFTGSGTTRVLTAGPDAANSQLAELYRINEAGQKVSVGIYNMPLQVTVTEQ